MAVIAISTLGNSETLIQVIEIDAKQINNTPPIELTINQVPVRKTDVPVVSLDNKVFNKIHADVPVFELNHAQIPPFESIANEYKLQELGGSCGGGSTASYHSYSVNKTGAVQENTGSNLPNGRSISVSKKLTKLDVLKLERELQTANFNKIEIFDEPANYICSLTFNGHTARWASKTNKTDKLDHLMKFISDLVNNAKDV